MIASVQGTVATTQDDYLVVEVNGMGYKVYVPYSAITFSPGESVYFHTYLVVREDALILFGFKTQPEQELFETLLSISGVGPRVALSILGTLSIDNLRNAVVSDRAEILARVPGIGKKTAQKILFELKDKLSVGLDAAPSTAFDDVNSDVLDTLVALGYSIVEAQSAIQSLPPDTPNDVEERVRLALQYFV